MTTNINNTYFQQSAALQTVRLLFAAPASSTLTPSAGQDASARITEIITASKVSVSPAFHDVLLSFAVEAGQAVARSKVEGSFEPDPGLELYKEWESDYRSESSGVSRCPSLVCR